MFNEPILECHNDVIFQRVNVLFNAADVIQRRKRTAVVLVKFVTSSKFVTYTASSSLGQSI
jgi:hypothetical protein